MRLSDRSVPCDGSPNPDEAAILELVEGYFARHGRPRRGSRILAAVSGGADSVAMLQILVRLAQDTRWTVGVAHVNHGLRGRASTKDCRFVRNLTESLGLQFHSKQLNPDSKAKNENTQAWARTQRYRFLEEAANRYGYTHIAVAHNLNDRAETVAAAVLDAGGTFALSGIPPVRDKIFRPLFDVPRVLIESYLKRSGAAYREDESNRLAKYQRNRIRNEVLPMWQRENPSIVSGLARMGEQFWMQKRLLEKQASLILRRARVNSPDLGEVYDLANLSRYDAALDPYVLRALAQSLGVDIVPTPATVSRFTELRQSKSRSGLSVVEQGKLRIVYSQGFLCVSKDGSRQRASMRAISGDPRQWLRTRIMAKSVAPEPDDRLMALLDFDKLEGEVAVRLPVPGDRYQPIGLEGTKKLFDILADRKVPSFQRPLIPVVVDDQGILWAVGCPIAHRARLTSRTRRVLEARVLEGSWKKRS